VQVDGTSVGAITAYKFTNVTANHTISASFAINQFTITPSAGPNGGITPNTVATLDYGTNSPVYTFTPATDYYVSDVQVDGVSVGPVPSYQFTNVQASHTINVVFATKQVVRIGGADRYAVALAAAFDAYPGWAGVNHVVIVSGDTNAQFDAVSAAGLAGAYNGPLLLVRGTGTLRGDIRNAIVAMPDGVQVHVVGGSGSVSNSVLSQLRSIPGVAGADRIAGADRYETAANVARRMQAVLGAQFPKTALIINGTQSSSMYEGLASSAIAAKQHFPVLLTRSNGVPVSTASALFDLGLTERWLVANPTAVPESIRSALGVPAGNRITGPDRYSMATALATQAKASGWLGNSVLGFGSAIPDAITGGAYMGVRNGALLYVAPTSVPAATANFVSATKAGLTGGYVFGGTASVSESVRLQLQTLMR